ncbi:hypothetical protein IFM89_003799 [Coptis chinensis]|uniref:Uncharacterized protein n=1 Tax=Coptis chinensis TaxID=261450 RepID=A0A835M3M3_9MAGN|nr:hypothetical protein IFM89_003799 [Coptis chinensis]
MVIESKSSNIVKKVKPTSTTQGGPSKGKVVTAVNNNSNNQKKKIETSSSTKQIVDSQHKSVTTFTKSEVKDKTSTSSTKTITKTVTVRAKKKVYTLAGQKYDPPEEREPLRIFYESLSKQIPSSEMAAFWMMEHGLLSPERAKRAYERKQKRQQQLRMGTPIKSLPKLNRPESSQKPQASKNGDSKGKRKLVNESDDDDDFIVKRKKGKG